MPRRRIRTVTPDRIELAPAVLQVHGIPVPAKDYHTVCRLTAIFYGKTFPAAASPAEAQRASARYALQVLQEWEHRQRSSLQEILGGEGDPE